MNDHTRNALREARSAMEKACELSGCSELLQLQDQLLRLAIECGSHIQFRSGSSERKLANYKENS